LEAFEKPPSRFFKRLALQGIIWNVIRDGDRLAKHPHRTQNPRRTGEETAQACDIAVNGSSPVVDCGQVLQ